MISIYDDVFDYEDCTYAWRRVTESVYRLGWLDVESLGGNQYVNLYSGFSPEDVKRLGILEKLKDTPLQEHIKDKEFDKCIVNLTVAGQSFFHHVHQDRDAVLFYVNLEWKREWAGETLFYSKDSKQLERAVEYIPNRVVFFEGEHPHAIRPASFHAPFFRFTVSVFFKK